jgi:hypothetical protein
LLDGLQTVLDVAGFIPGVGEVADLANAGISALRGNHLEAGLSLIALIPGMGDAVGKGAKYALKFADAGAARKALDALKKADVAGFFDKLAKSPQVAKYVKPLQQALDTLGEKLAEIAGVPKPNFAIAGEGSRSSRNVPSGPQTNSPMRANGASGGGYKRGDHLFNHGLKKIDLPRPKIQVLAEAYDRFKTGLRQLESNPAFSAVVNKGAHGADMNSQVFGDRLAHLRNTWTELNTVLNNPRANAQQRASAVTGAADALRSLRQSSFDDEAVSALKKTLNPNDFRKLEGQIRAANQALDNVFGDLAREIERFMPSPSEVGQSISGGGTRPKPR